jgi:hypothetical protein
MRRSRPVQGRGGALLLGVVLLDVVPLGVVLFGVVVIGVVVFSGVLPPAELPAVVDDDAGVETAATAGEVVGGATERLVLARVGGGAP